MSERSNITLIGMPGAGKSTLGILLAKALAKDFLDTDVLIQQREGRTLQDYQQEHGLEAFQAIEADVLCNLSVHNCVIATGGSAVYSEAAMQALALHSRIVFIDVPLDVLSKRIHNMESRGIVQKPGQDFSALYRERWPLYERAAEIRIDTDHHAMDAVLALMIDRLNKHV
ncbi:shikimate kinase [Litorivivens lipolytica]|uniref:Shikimate kinase n=1 Tax=Litorivivens lipolytica TaxID=1524264 RepID=A0A7W4Z6G8_9GAMM|nr:shikimate kinase [Litorivivens lipolytica]MBB3048499.1 shikimate kinase [Litorivivens lipolytica]